MDVKRALLALLATGVFAAGSPAVQAHAEPTGQPSCLGVSAQGDSATMTPPLTLVPGDSGSSALLVRNDGFTEAQVTASLVKVTDPGDAAFAKDVTLSVGGVTKPVSDLIGRDTPMATATIPAGQSITLPVAYAYDVDATHIPRQVTRFSYGLSFTLTGDQENPVEVSCSTAPIRPTNPLSIASTPTVKDVNGNGRTDAGDSVTYLLRIANADIADIADLHVRSWVVPGSSAPTTSPTVAHADPNGADAPAGGTQLKVTCADTAVAAKGSTDCSTEAYTVTEADVAAGGITNISRATARNVAGADVQAPEATAQVDALAPPTSTPEPTPSPTEWTDVTTGQTPTKPTEPDTTVRTIIDAGVSAVASLGWGAVLAGLPLTAAGAVFLRRRRQA